MIKKIVDFFSKPTNLALLNGALISMLILFNAYFQAFCIPTNWTIVLLAICFTNTILSPLLETTKFAPLNSFISGVTFFIFVYCVIFLEQMNFWGLLMILVGLGLVNFIPHFFIVQLVRKNLIQPANKISRYSFIGSILICMAIVIYIGQVYKHAIHSMEKFEKSHYTVLEKSFMTEKILGMPFIYHTRFCEFDGWRPPKHEPILVIGM